jgi:ABC-type amino acid transport substrate-binding protein
MSSSKAVLWLFFVSVMYMGGFAAWAQKGPPTGEGFVLTFEKSAIHTLADLRGQRICGSLASFQAFRELTGVQNVTHVAVPFYEGVQAMERGMCVAVVAYSTDIGRVRQEGSRWNQNPAFRVIFFP